MVRGVDGSHAGSVVALPELDTIVDAEPLELEVDEERLNCTSQSLSKAALKTWRFQSTARREYERGQYREIAVEVKGLAHQEKPKFVIVRN